MLSKTEEDYLKAIYKISEKSQSVARTSDISEYMHTSPASVTDMLKKLSAKSYIDYEKYKGVSLTTEGSRIATNLIRRHRLWEVFLCNKLRFTWDKIHDIAEELEHIDSEELIQRLDAFLDYPKYDPHGDPIPNANGKFTLRNQRRLVDVPIGVDSQLVGVREYDDRFLKYLSSINLNLGSKIKVLSRNDYDQSLVLNINDEAKDIMLSNMITEKLLVKLVN